MTMCICNNTDFLVSTQKLRISAINGMMSSILAQDFLLATSVLILDVDEDLVSPLPVPSSRRVAGVCHLDSAPPTRQEIVETLRSAYYIWSKASKKSQEARKAAAAVKIVLSKVKETEEHATSPSYCEFLCKTTLSSHKLTLPSCK